MSCFLCCSQHFHVSICKCTWPTRMDIILRNAKTLTLAHFNASVFWDVRDPAPARVRPVNQTPRESAFLCPRDLVKRRLISPRGVASLLIISLLSESFVMMTDGPFNQRNEKRLLETNCPRFLWGKAVC